MVGMTSSSVLISIMKDVHVYMMSVWLILIVSVIKETNSNSYSDSMVGCFTSLQAFGMGIILNT